jgi:beta-mannosidase
MGKQPLYDVNVELINGRGEVVDAAKRHIGLRSIRLTPRTDQHPMQLAINGRPIYLKGANWIPCEIFPTDVTETKLRRFVQEAAAAHMNALRCWGGGYYEEDAFYDACDEAGILVWMDFKFACAAYPTADPAFMANVAAEADDNIRRLRNHPSIAVWSGNNEVHALVSGYHVMRQEDYDRLFNDQLRRQVAALVPGAAYVPGSPDSGDEHNWWVWHVGAPFEKYLDSHGLMTEFGFQSFPCPATVDSYTAPADRASALTDVMQFHQRNGNGRGNPMILEMMGRYFRKPRNLDMTLWLSQINQAYGMTLGIEHWRSDWPNSTGDLIWQYDDIWPGPSWSCIDYFGRWKAVMYRVRAAYAPLMVTAKYEAQTGTVQVIACSDKDRQSDATLNWQLTTTNGDVIGGAATAVSIPAGPCAVQISTLDLASQLGKIGRADALLWLTLATPSGEVSKKLVAFQKFADINLVDPALAAEVRSAADGFDVRLTCLHPALYAWTDLENDPDARYSDNFVDVRPGEPALLHVTTRKDKDADTFRANLRVYSLYDTFDPR